MRITNEELGWGVVICAAGALLLILIGRLKQPRFPDVLPEQELARLAQLQVDWIIIEGEITHTEGVLMSRREFNVLSGSYPASENLDYPVYVYRAYGNIKQAMIFGLDGFPDYYFQAVEVALNAKTGVWLGTLTGIPKDVTPYSLRDLPQMTEMVRPDFPPPTVVQLPASARVTPERTAETAP